ncbi:hypothetical protein HUG17_1162 [Dermatophagoides farinae]|nr:hypothetical protein HUG17_1162 [Dermatophagoides farinae]
MSIYCFMFLSLTFFNIGSSFLNPLNRDFLFLPKLSNHGRLQLEASRPELARAVIYNRDRLDPANQNVYQDSATLKIKNRSGNSEDELILSDDDSKIPSDSSNHYVPVTVKKQESRSNPSTSPDVSVHSNNFQNEKRHPKDRFVDADEFLKSKPDGEANSKNRQDDPFIQFEKEFENIFKLDDFKDFFNTRILI